MRSGFIENLVGYIFILHYTNGIINVVTENTTSPWLYGGSGGREHCQI
jgi:hypothetical protein